ncbi:MAG: RES family NAD+ phosphorylase [Deltaproteobacteria bacterium]|nr:RES family NAD+ phosphorylase [Deltaproteobacteria bacterium]
MASTADLDSGPTPWLNWRDSPRTIYRLTSGRYRDRAFEGEGARRYGGRWNHRGIAVVYASQSLSLACLEALVQVGPDTLPDEMVSIAAILPADLPVLRLDPQALPDTWRRYPASADLQDLGSRWARSGASAALAVPSAVIPQEWNFLLNPRHPEFAAIEAMVPEAFAFDSRLVGAEPSFP